ncbi:MAG: hypothetical protein JXR76_02740 [Deltaproteobacteria bacterium]|nr:hypothetical protein [Deltaproteobacteria bacterium]
MANGVTLSENTDGNDDFDDIRDAVVDLCAQTDSAVGDAVGGVDEYKACMSDNTIDFGAAASCIDELQTCHELAVWECILVTEYRNPADC